jgi:catechol-2,3-dioxygenase
VDLEAWQLENFDELQAAYRELKALGVPIESTIEHNVTRSVYFPDPDGNRVELYCTWRGTASRPCAP